MVDRFWVGGTGTWNLTTNWSATSGGAGGASVPGTSDWAIFDANSGTGTITLTAAGTPGIIAIRNCSPLTLTGAFAISTATGQPFYYEGGTFTFSNLSASFPAGLVVGYLNPATSGTLTFSNTTTTTFSGGGASLPYNVGIYFNSTGANVTIANTTTVTIQNINVPNTATTGTLSIQNPSTATISGALTYNSSSAILNVTSAVTSLTMSGANPFAITGTAANVTINTPSLILSGSGNINTNNCPITSNITKTVNTSHTLTGNFTTTGTLTINNSTTTGTFSVGNFILTASTLTTNGTWVFGTGAVYLTGTSGTVFNTSGSNFAITGTSNFNLTAAAAAGGTRTITMNSASTPYVNFSVSNGVDAVIITTTTKINNFDFTGFSGTLDATSVITAMTGNLTLSSTMAVPDAATAVSFGGTSGTQTVTSNGVALNRPITVNTTAGVSVVLADNFSTLRAFTHTQGTLNVNGKTLTALTFASNNANTRVIAWGTNGKIKTTGTGTVYTTSTLTGLSATGNGTLELSGSSATSTTVDTGAGTGSQRPSLLVTGNGTYTLALAGNYENVDFSGFNGSITAASLPTIFGDATFSSVMVLTTTTNAIVFGATSGPKSITTNNNQNFNRPFTFDGVGGSWKLIDSLTMQPIAARIITLNNGTLDLNGKTLTTIGFTTGAGTKNLTFNGGILTLTGSTGTAFNNAVPTGFTTTAGTAKGSIYMTGSSAKSFVGGGSTFAATLVQAGAGALTLSGNNTFSSIKNTTQPAPITFTASSTTTFVDDFKLKGTGGSLIVITSTVAGTAATVSKSGVAVNCDYLSVKDNTPAGGASWYAGAHSTLVSNYTGTNGWFNRPPPSANTEFLTFLQ